MPGQRWQDGAPPLEGEILPPEATRERDRFVRDSFWTKLKAVIARIPFADSALAAFYCATDPGTPTRVRLTLMGALAYFILPIDLIPDFIPVLGYTDDAAVLALAIKIVGDNITKAHWLKARETLRAGFAGAKAEA